MWAALPSGSETIIQGLSGSKEEAQETFLHSVLQNEGRCWVEFCMLNDVKKIEKIFRRLRTTMAKPSQIQWKRPNP